MRQIWLTFCIVFVCATNLCAQEYVSSSAHLSIPSSQVSKIQEENKTTIRIESDSWHISQFFRAQLPMEISLAGLKLSCDSSNLQHDIECSVEILHKSKLPVLSANLINVTADAQGYRLLPNGEHFMPPATLEIAYNANSLPIGFKPHDIYTYYYNEDMQRWEVLPRLGIDTTRHIVISATTHFTDFINAVIRTPDMPEVSAFVPTMLQDMEEPHSFAHLALIAEPQVNNYGSAQTTYPIEIPAGRNGLQPDVSLSYNSANGNGLLGYGWSIPQSSITIDTRWGVPRYDTKYESEIYCLNGMQCVLKDNNPELKLPYQSNTQISRKSGHVQFIARDTKNCDKIIRHGSNPKNYWWEVIGRDGTISYYGKYANDNAVNPNCILKDANGNIGYWALTEVVDISGNFIRYEYAVSPTHEIYPKYIYYTGHKSPDGTIDLPTNYRIFFHYDQRPDVLQDGRLGFVRQTDSIMCYIDITYLNNDLGDNAYCWFMNHRFFLRYNDSSTISLLTQIHDYINYFDVRWSITDDCNPPTKRNYRYFLRGITYFDYYDVSPNTMFSGSDIVIQYPQSSYTSLNKSENSSWSVGGTATVGFGKSVWNTNLSVGGNYNYSQSNGKTEQMLLDINGDGLTDLVYVKNNAIYFRPQYYVDNQPQFEDEINTGIPSKGLSVETSKTNTWGLQAGVEAFGANANVSGGMSYTDTYTTCYFADVNGDGLPDYINDGKVYFNRLNTYGGFIAHNGDDEVVIDSTRCTNFYYDGEVEVLPDCIVKDTIVSKYVFNTPDCSLGYYGTEPEYTEKPILDFWDCEVCQEKVLEYIRNGDLPIDLHSVFIDNYGLRHARTVNESTGEAEEAAGGEDWIGIDERIVHCLKYCNYELVCEECLDYYEWYLQEPNDPYVKEMYEHCKQENGCRTICSECYEYLLNGDEDGYLACADVYCLNGALEGMNNPCYDCYDVCVDDINNCKECIYKNPTCFVCAECQDICINQPEECNQCKLEYNCLGAIPRECEEACLIETDDPYICQECLLNMEAYCEECIDICLNNPEYCFSCINRRCHYDDTEAFRNECWDNAWRSYRTWERNTRAMYPNIVIKKTGNIYYAHQIDTICPEKTDPEIEAIRVWVAPKAGTVTLHSSIQLIQDTGTSRLQARQVDGVRCLIQHNKNVTVNANTHTLQAQSSHIIGTYDIAADDYQQKDKTYANISVQPGDVFFFHLRSHRTHNFDNVNWTQTFTYTDGNSYSSENDYICSSEDVFQTEDNGTIILNTDIVCPTNTTASLKILINNHIIDEIPIHSSISHSRKQFSYASGTSVSLELSSNGNLGRIEARPYLTFTPQTDNPSFNQWIAPHAVFTQEIELDSIYYHLFGPLYRGWGQFAYNNIDAVDIIPIRSLVNSAVEYAQTAPSDSTAFCQSITFTDADTLQLMQEGGLEAAFSSRNLYNPLENVWIQMSPDISQYRWEAYGRVARNGRHLLSNTRDTKAMVSVFNPQDDSEDENIDFDSEVPVSSDGKRITTVRKTSKVKQWNVNAGIGITNYGLGHTHSESDYTVTTDFMDMNGDGYPDVVRTSTIQYTQPWGGLGENKNVNVEAYSNHSVSDGHSLSGNYAYAIKAPGVNMKDGKFLSHVNGNLGGSETSTRSEAAIGYIDVNGDGLPDKLIRRDNSILYCLNIGYGFATPNTLLNVSQFDNNISICAGGNLGASGNLGWGEIEEVTQNILGTNHPTLTSKYQISLAAGADINWSRNTLTNRLVDMNGDGIQDIVKQTDDGFIVILMSAREANQQIAVENQAIQRSTTLNWGINAGITVGFPIWFVKICVGVNGSPKGKSTTQVTHDLIDMNGDGLPDLVWTAEDGIHIRYNQLGKNRLLKTITNPTGQKIQLDYELSSPTYEQRGRRWLLNSVCNIDPYAHPMLGCDTMMHTYSYEDPHYDYAERQFLGYGVTVSHDINTDSLPHTTYRKTVRRYNNTDFIENGKLLYESLSDADGHLFREYEIGTWYVDSTFTPTDNLCGDASIRVGTEVHYTRYYEGTADRIVTAKKYEYDKYHNVKEYTNLGDSALTNDDLRAVIEYDSTEINTHNLVSSPKKLIVYNNGTATREVQAEYQKGLITELRQTDLLLSHTDTTNYHYTSFGLPDSILFPSNINGERAYTSVVYDIYSHTLPAIVTDQWGRTRKTVYDKFLKKPLNITEPSGGTWLYSYDTLGRVLTVAAPGETRQINTRQPMTYEKYATVFYTYSQTNMSNASAYPYVKTKHINENAQKFTYYDSRGEILYRKHERIESIDWQTQWSFTDLDAPDCFGRKRTVFSNYIDSNYSEDATLITDSLQVFTSSVFDIIDRPLQIKWQDDSKQTYRYSIGEDAFGEKRMKQVFTDEGGHTIQQFKTPQGWITTSILPNNNITTFLYDAFGQLQTTTDPDGLSTTYQYDGLGRRIKRQQPDAGTTIWNYDLAGNLVASATQQQINNGTQTNYEYDYNRLKAIHYPQHPQLDIMYDYDSAGRIAKRTDITGCESLQYDSLGNVSVSDKMIVIPTEDKAYRFRTQFTYNNLGNITGIIYPDNEKVTYSYVYGKLYSIYNSTNVWAGIPYYLYSLDYDAYDRPLRHRSGDGYITDFTYNPYKQWLDYQTTYDKDHILQDIHYSYDAVGNITSIEQMADSVRWLGGAYLLEYQYDSLNRLTKADMVSDYFGEYSNYTMNYSPSGLVGLKSCNDMLWNYWYGYSTNSNGTLLNHQVRSIYDIENDETAFLQWDTDGQLQNILRPCSGDMRHHWWNEAGQMVAFVDNERCGYYGYDGNGERIYKLTGQSVVDQYNAGEQNFQMFLNDAVLYVNPYMVVTPKGYTKHYYNGSQRIAAQIGKLEDLPNDIIDTSAVAMERIANARAYMEAILNISEIQPIDTTSVFADIEGDALDELQWQCNDEEWTLNATVHCDSNLLYPILTKDTTNLDKRVSDIYYYHPDHLGSATWITNSSRVPVEFIHYMPFGELWYNQQASAYNERFKFTGKERDTETGYDYFGARYYSSALPMWLSVDPLADKYPNISPYAYCHWNPVKYVDPDGKSTHTNEDGIVVAVYDDNDLNIYKHSNTTLSSWGDVYTHHLTTDDADIMGQSLHSHSFADQNYYNSIGETRHASNMRIDFGSYVLGDEIINALNSKPPLFEYALKAKSGGNWDFKKHYKTGSQIFENVYLSPRDAGNFLAGAIKGQSGLLAPVVQFGYGAYNLSGNSILKTGLLTLGTGMLMYKTPLLGMTAATLIMNGEDRLSQLSINIGFNYVRQ